MTPEQIEEIRERQKAEAMNEIERIRRAYSPDKHFVLHRAVRDIRLLLAVIDELDLEIWRLTDIIQKIITAPEPAPSKQEPAGEVLPARTQSPEVDQ